MKNIKSLLFALTLLTSTVSYSQNQDNPSQEHTLKFYNFTYAQVDWDYGDFTQLHIYIHAAPFHTYVVESFVPTDGNFSLYPFNTEAVVRSQKDYTILHVVVNLDLSHSTTFWVYEVQTKDFRATAPFIIRDN